jgi:sortase A
VTLSTQMGAPGDVVLVTIERWPGSTVSVSLCGNEARRGSRDCDLLGAQSVNIEPAGPTVAPLPLTVPPVGCPCVVRVADQAGDVAVHAIPIALNGVPDSPALADEPAPESGLEVGAQVKRADTGWPRSWLPAFAGATPRVLVVTIRNLGAAATHDLRLDAAVGRDRDSGEPIGTQVIEPVAPGETRRVTLPFSVPGPVWGEYVVYGSISGASSRHEFAARTDNDPWALELVAPLLLLGFARVLRRRERRRRAGELPPDVSGPVFRDCSPDVGVRVEERCAASAYDPRVHDPTPDRGLASRREQGAPVG